MDKTQTINIAYDRVKFIAIFFACQVYVPMTMRSCNSLILEEYLVCIQMSLHNRLIIKALYRYLRRCLLGWHRSRLDLSLRVSERYLWALSVMHINIILASNAANVLVTACSITERVKRLAGNKIELGIEIPTIESGQVTYR